MTSLEVTRRRLMQLGLSAGATALGGSLMFRPSAARAAGGVSSSSFLARCVAGSDVPRGFNTRAADARRAA